MEAYDYASLLLRLAVGGIMLAHGIKHARGKEKTSRWFGSIGFKSPTTQWFASTATEIGVGVLLLAGFLTAAAAAGVIGVMTVAFFSVHRSVGFWVTARPDEGWEYVMLIAAVSAAIAIGGPGEISVDGALGIAADFNGWIGAGIAAAGVVVALLQMAIFFRPSEVANS